MDVTIKSTPTDRERFQLLSRPVQTDDLALVKQLSANDLLLVDSSHVYKVGSDVQDDESLHKRQMARLTLDKSNTIRETFITSKKTNDVGEIFFDGYAKDDNNKYGLINLPRFYVDFDDYGERNAASDIRKEIISLKDKGIDGLILDLRNNGGGSLIEAVKIAGFFIPSGPIVQVKNRRSLQILPDVDPTVEYDGPLIILVNRLSASASEILAAAMQDYKRAIVIGSQNTYGKGTVQNIIDLNKMVRNNTNGEMGALKFTTQKYYRVTGGSTQLKGVKSDVIIPSRYSNVEIGERDQDNPLPWDEIKSANYKPWVSKVDYQFMNDIKRAYLSSSEMWLKEGGIARYIINGGLVNDFDASKKHPKTSNPKHLISFYKRDSK